MMSNLTEITYSDGDVVWVRLSSYWWPGEVCGPSRLPEGLLESMKKKPLAVVRFFQEDTYEYVKNIDHICLYNSSKKNQFIKKGLDGHRAKKKMMETFPEDVVTAEKMTNGDPDIINYPEFQPQKKEKWSDLFAGPAKPGKRGAGTPRAIQAHRKSDHEVRILEQNTSPVTPSGSSGNPYKCNVCSFSTSRMNVFILHNKNHTKEELQSPKKAAVPAEVKRATPKTTTKSLRVVKQAPIIDDYVVSEDEIPLPKGKKRKSVKKSVTPKRTPKASAKATKTAASAKKTASPPSPKPNLEIKSSLLADWSDDEAANEEVAPSASSSAKPEAPEKPEPPVKCRNIPKKRDFTFDDLKGEKSENQEEKEPPKEEEELLEKLLDEVGGEGNRSETPRSTRKNRKTPSLPPTRASARKKATEVVAEVQRAKDESAELQKELEKPAEEGPKEEQKEDEETPKGKKGAKGRKGKTTPKSVTPVENVENLAKNENKAEEAEITESAESSTEEKPALRVSRRNRKTTEKVVENIEAQEELKLLKTKKAVGKRERKSEEAPPKSAKKQKKNEDVEAEIEALLNETAVPIVTSELEPKPKIKLTPKERGKRQFKSSKTESELLIAETLTQLPQTAIQFSPKKTPASRNASSNSLDEDAANSLINLSEPSPAKTDVETPKKRQSGQESDVSETESKRSRVDEPHQSSKIIPKKRKPQYTNEFEEFLHRKRPDEDVVKEVTVKRPAKTKSSDELFDIEKMDIVFDSSPVSPASSSGAAKKKQQQIVSTTTKTIIPKKTSDGSLLEVPLSSRIPKVISRPSSVTGSPTKVQEIRRLSSPTQRTIESIRRETIGPHRKTLKVIREADGRQTLVEEVAPKIVLRPASGSPTVMRAVEKTPPRQKMSSPVPPRGTVIPKGQMVEAPSNKIVITSKGAMITTTSPVSSTTQAPSIKSPARIQVQSQEIIMPKSKPPISHTSSAFEQSRAIVRKKELIVQHQQSQAAAAASNKEKPRTSKAIKMTQAQFREAEKLGYVEIRGDKKVLTDIGVAEFLPTLSPPKAPSSVTSVRKSNDSDTASAASDEGTTSAYFKTVRRKPSQSNSDVIVINEEDGKDVAKSQKKAQTESFAEDVIEEETVEETVATTPSVVAPSVTATTSKDVQDQNQILAVPAENFGGPTGAFYLCTAGEDGNLTPINNEALYLDASNQLVPVAPVEEKEESQSIILNTGDGQQIILDQQALLALASQGGSGETPHIITQDGQQLILPGTAQDILAALASANPDGDQPILIQTGQDQDILATALANTEVLLAPDTTDVGLAPMPPKAQVSETNTVLTQSPIMSTSEQPPAKNNGEGIKADLELKNLDDSLAVIGVTTHTNVPVSLELPITVTNPAIAPKTTTNPLEVNQIYPAATVAVASPSLLSPTVVSSPLELQEILQASSNSKVIEEVREEEVPEENDVKDETVEGEPLLAPEVLAEPEAAKVEEPVLAPEIIESNGSPAVSTAILTPESSDEIIPDTPEPIANHQTDTNSSEIPLQSNNVSEELLENHQEVCNNGTEEAKEEADQEHDNMNNNGAVEKEVPSVTAAEPAEPMETETIESVAHNLVTEASEPMEVDESR